MEVSESLTRRDESLQLVQKDTRPLSLMDKLKGGCDNIESLEEMIDVERDLERYQKDTLRKIRPQQYIKWVGLKIKVDYTEYLEKLN